MTTTKQLIEWKTNAWKDPAMVAWYSGRMVEQSGPQVLKNRLEVELCLAHAIGTTLLDVGVGTGRGSLPLAQRGMTVTGIDSSQAMLDECTRLARAEQIEIRTRVAPLDSLPFADGSFDTLLSLNVLVHFPIWRLILPEWTRVVAPGGRLIFDVHSLDHYRAAAGRPVAEIEMLQADAGNYQLRVAAADLVAEADRLGLTVVALVPYGAFLGGGNRNFLLGGTEDKHSWNRLLTWFAADAAFLEFALFLERELVGRLTTTVAGRFMAVLERRADAAANRAWLEANACMEAALRSVPLRIDAVAARFALPPDEWRRQLSTHLEASLRNRRLLEFLLAPLVRTGRSDWGELPGPWDAWFADLAQRREADRLADDLAMRLPHEPAAMAAALDVGGVSAAGGLEYFLLERLLTTGLRHFTGVRS